jgi:hypothetical protein
MLFWHGYTLIFSAPRAEYKKFTAKSSRLQRNPRVTPGTEKIASSHTSQHLMEIRGHRCNKSFWHGYTLIFSAPRAEQIHNLQQEPCIPPGTENASSHTPQHLIENSCNHPGEVPIYGWTCIYTNVSIASTTISTISTGPTVLPWLGSSQG